MIGVVRVLHIIVNNKYNTRITPEPLFLDHERLLPIFGSI